MIKRRNLPFVLAAVLAVGGIARGEAVPSGIARGIRAKFGLGTGFVSRTVRWDGDVSRVKTFTVGLASEFEFPFDLTASLFAGLGLTNYRGALFEHLPVTLRVDAGGTASFVAGGEVRKKIRTFGNFETGAIATFVTSFGTNKTWPIAGFAVDGEARGTPRWTGFEIGPTVSYLGYRNFVPFASIRASWFGGRFKMTEKLGELESAQTRTFKQKGLVKICLGASGAISPRLSLRGEATIVPASGRIDLGAAVRLLYAY